MARRVVAKLVAPRARQIVRRGRVLSAIDRALRSGACWIAAPAGYGKTIAVTDYLQKTRAPHIWYRVDDGDHDVASFFHYMALSVQGARARGVLPCTRSAAAGGWRVVAASHAAVGCLCDGDRAVRTV